MYPNAKNPKPRKRSENKLASTLVVLDPLEVTSLSQLKDIHITDPGKDSPIVAQGDDVSRLLVVENINEILGKESVEILFMICWLV